MARKSISGLYERNGTWHIDKIFKGERLLGSTGTSSREEAEKYLIHLLEERRQQEVYGVRKSRTWREAATKYLLDFADQPSIELTATYLEQLDPFVGDTALTHIDDDALAPFVEWMKKGGGELKSGRKKKPNSHRTINIALQRVVRILHLCNRKWRDEKKRPWLDVVPSISMLDERKTKRPPYPISWDEQRILFKELPDHLHRMALFKVNTGVREQEVCKLSWDWEIEVPELNTSVFIVPPEFGGRHDNAGVKNRDERVIILNDVAKSIIDQQRLLLDDDENEAKHLVFPYKGRALHRMNDTAWRSARIRAAATWKNEYGEDPHPGFATVRVHDMKHTFGRRLKAADITFEDRQALLGHKSGSVTTHYSGAELAALIRAANRISATDNKTPTLTILRRKAA